MANRSVPQPGGQPEPEHVGSVVLDEMIRMASVSFSEGQLFYLADGFDAAGHAKYRTRIEADTTWCEAGGDVS